MVAKANHNVNIIKIQKIESDQSFTFRPSRGPYGIILNAANTEFPHNQAITNCSTNRFEVKPRRMPPQMIPMAKRIRLDIGPTNAIFPFCDFTYN